MSEPGPIHPALAPLARAAKIFGKTLRTTNVAPGGMVEALRDAVAKDRGWLRPEHRVGDPTAYMRHVLYIDPEDRFVISAITWLPGQSSAAHGHQV